jgi:6-pyruvoyltetrahydropterin/6-carboxytetrahydropterin synthase
MPFEVRVRVDDVAVAHWLPGYPGPCARLHGHNLSLEAVVAADRLHEDMVVDFALVKEVLRGPDHRCLNDDPEITEGGRRPTAERLAEVLAARLQRALDALPHRPRVVRVTVWETGRNEVTYTP